MTSLTLPASFIDTVAVEEKYAWFIEKESFVLHTVTLDLPEEMHHLYQRGALAARKRLETFMIERLGETAPPLADEPYTQIDDELVALEQADNQTLRQVAQSRLPRAKQKLYDALLEKNSQGLLTDDEATLLHELGEEARQLTLKKAHAYMLLKWRGQAIPSPTIIVE